MKWLIYGSKGWIGQMIIAQLELEQENVILLGQSRVDNEVDVEKEVVTYKPDRILCLIGRTHGKDCPTIDYLEHKDKLMINVRDNLYGPLVLTIICQKYDIHLTYLGTGCIFNDLSMTRKYTEDDLPDFFGSSYSTVKGFTDRLLHFFDRTVLNVRIRMPIVGYHHPRNFITKIVNYDKICSIPNSMTVLPDLIPVLIDLAMKRMTGTFNLTNPGIIEHNEILQMYKEYVDPEYTWTNFSNQEQNLILSSERSNNHLDTCQLETLYPDIPTIHDSIEHLLKSWYNSNK